MITTLTLGLALAAKSFVTKGTVLRNDSSPQRAVVAVMGCKKAEEDIYADPKMVVLLPNAIFTDAFGGFKFYSQHPEHKLLIVGDDLRLVVDTCKGVK